MTRIISFVILLSIALFACDFGTEIVTPVADPAANDQTAMPTDNSGIPNEDSGVSNADDALPENERVADDQLPAGEPQQNEDVPRQNGDVPANDEPPVPVTSFSKDIQPMLTANCTAALCHGEVNPAGGIRLTNYEAVRAQVTPGNAARSRLYREISGSRPAMPKNAPPLSDADVALIAEWINLGAGNN